MARAAGLIATLLIVAASIAHAAPIAHAAEGAKVLVLPFRAIGVGDETITAVRTVLSGELEARGFVMIRRGDRSSVRGWHGHVR